MVHRFRAIRPLQSVLEVHPATTADLCRVAEDMREHDRLECWVHGHSPAMALMSAGFNTWCAFVGDRPVAAYGCENGCPWLLGTDELFEHRREIIRNAPRIVKAWKAQYGVLHNYVLQDNQTHVRWLKRLGAVFGDPVPAPLHPDYTLIPFRI